MVQPKLSSLSLPENGLISGTISTFFQYFKYFLCRMEYSMTDYFNHKITIQNLFNRHFLIVTLNSLIMIFNLIIGVVNKNMQYIIILYGQFLGIERLDLLNIAAINIIGILECMSMFIINGVLSFKLFIHDIILLNLQFNDQRLSRANRNYIIGYFNTIRILSPIAYYICLSVAISAYIFIIFKFTGAYFENKLSLFPMLLRFLMFAVFLKHGMFMLSQMFYMLPMLMYLIEFIKIRFVQFIQTTKVKLISNKKNSLNFFPVNIIREYYLLYNETSKVNSTTKSIFIFLEYMSKVSIIFCAIFYSKQIKFGIYNYIMLTLFFILFTLTTIIYSRLSAFPYLNQLFIKLVIYWNVHNNFILMNSKNKPNLFGKIYSRYFIKTNLFIQNVNRNRFGFTCGQLFLITKFRYIELFLLNFTLIMLFYKKVCLNSN